MGNGPAEGDITSILKHTKVLLFKKKKKTIFTVFQLFQYYVHTFP